MRYVGLGQNHQIVVNNNEYYSQNSKYYIATNKYGYVLNGLELYYDGIDNQGTGRHSTSATTWKDLSGNNRDGTLINFGNSAVSGWNANCLSFDGVNDWVNCGVLNLDNVTLEAAFIERSYTSGWRGIIGNWEGGGYGIRISGTALATEVYVGSKYNVVNSSKYNKHKLTTLSMTYDNLSNVCYVDGKKGGTITTEGGAIKPPINNTVLAINSNPRRK
ncbi:MAG: hypothetical protein HFJ50_04595 [Clostridia bacterium]|nr:hypothetical protein [Clostridia bacterium]